ncbi:MAG: heat-shock protein, partial [Variovorax sp.]
LGPERMGRPDRAADVLATSGVHIGGTDFDQRLNLERVMPEFGFRHKDARGREVPSKVFFELSSWHLINWLYAAKAVRQAKELRTSYAERGLSVTLGVADMARELADPLAKVVASAHECVRRAGLRSNDLDALYLTGGSSALRAFQEALRRGFAGVRLVEGDLFGGVAAGLAYTARTAGTA